MEERLRSLEEQLERVTAQLTEHVEQLKRLTAQVTEREAHAAPGTAERVTDVTAQLTEQVSALAAASTEHGTRLAGVERRTNEQAEEWESLRAWWQRREARFVPAQLMDGRNLGLRGQR